MTAIYQSFKLTFVLVKFETKEYKLAGTLGLG